ncbi:hydroxypyruvate isomerase family protein [Marinibacterium sp. SX1]|uniref:hydroxypyruvate isomerase family protein n=1 Tax=Marinibacterium sp. SX1 TaxID=3388424 RepID=UPI003D17C216
MPRFAANLSLLWTELPYLDRFAAAAEAGFDGVEVLFPYEFAAQETRRALISAGLDFVLMNAPPPNYTGGVPGYGALVGGEDRFARDIRRVLRYAELLRPDHIHVMAGEGDGADARATFVRNLQLAADTAPGQAFTIEPLNRGSFPGYFLADYDLALDIIAAVDRPNLGLQYDTFHATEIHGDALAVWDRVAPHVTHAQIGDAPGRGAPGSGHVDFRAIFAAMDDSGYAGWVSAEYQPGIKTEKTLGWMKG